MKDIKEFIFESKFKNILNKILHPFTQTYDLPYIAFNNGNCYAPNESKIYDEEKINDILKTCIDEIKNKYNDQITKISDKYEKTDNNESFNTGVIVELGNCNETEAAEIFKKVIQKFDLECKPIFDSGEYGDLKLSKTQFTSIDNACVNSYAFQLTLKDKNDKFKNYLYPGISLVTDKEIEVFKK